MKLDKTEFTSYKKEAGRLGNWRVSDAKVWNNAHKYYQDRAIIITG